MSDPPRTEAPPTPPRHRRRRGVLGIAFSAALLLALAGAALAVAWALGSPGGSAWLLAHAPGVRVQAPRGALLDDFRADAVDIAIGADRLHVEALAWRSPHVSRGPPGTWLRLGFAELRAARVVWQPGPARPAAAPTPPPNDLRLPLALDVARLHVGEARFGDGDVAVVRDVDGELHLGAEDGAAHRVEHASLGWNGLQLAGSARIATEAPLDLRARIDATQPAAGALPAWQAHATATGPLAALQVGAQVRAQAAAERPAQRLDLTAVVRPFADWPLGDLQLALADFDVGALQAGWPSTRLTGRADVQTEGRDRPARASVHLANAMPGRWDEARIPVRVLDASLGARPDDRSTLDITAFTAELGAARPGGRLQGTGRWTTTGWSFDATLADVQPQRLDGRAPDWLIGGALAARSEPPAPGAAGAAAGIALRGTLDGRVTERGPLRRVALRFDASLAADRVDIRLAEAHIAEASATLEGRARRTGSAGAWHATGRAAVANLDPASFGVAIAGARARAPSRVEAQARFDLEGTPSASGAWLTVLAALRGSAEVTLGDSRIAGVGVRGNAIFRHEQAGPAQVQARVEAAGNRVDLSGRVDLATGTGDSWDATVEAPEIAALAPLAQAFGSSARAAASGRARAELHVRGRWPALETRGALEASDVRLADARVAHATARWQIDTRRAGPMTLDADVAGAALGGRTVESLHAMLAGTAESHRLELRARAGALPPGWVDWVQPPTHARATGSSATLQAQGGLIAAPASSGPAAALAATGWRGRVETLDVRADAPDAAPWLHAEGLAFETHWGEGPLRLAAQPARIDVLGGRLQWTQLEWSEATSTTPLRLEVEASVDPIQVAPILRRAQPAFGWGGDLAVGGRMSLHGGASPRAAVVIERRGGDLSITDETGIQSFGLTDLRIALDAANGVWSFTQAVAGRTLGAASGSIVARVPGGAAWPTGETPIEGVVELQVANLGAWSTWVPPGWRLGGTLHASAHVQGRLAAPDATGRVTASSVSVRNFVEGVAIRDGEIAIALQGTRARIERFSAHAGDGTLALDGEATLGAAPQARLHLRAERFQVLGRVDRRIAASGDAQLVLDARHVGLDGRFAVDEGQIDFSRSEAPALGDDVHVVRRRPPRAPARGSPEAALVQRTAAEASAPTPAARALDLDLRVDMGQRLHIHGRGIDANLRGELHLTSPGGRLSVAGTVYTVDGTYQAYGQNLTIDRGQLVFSGPIDNPRLDIEATRPKLDVRVGVAVTGTALNPRVRLFSEPDMTEMEKVSWLVLGRASEGLGRDDMALVQRAALALLSGEGGGPSFTKRFGLDDLSLSQGTPGDVRSTIVSVGKQISRRWYVGYERGLNATSGSWQLIYRVARRLTVRAQSGEDNAVDVIWTWRWQ